MEQYSDRWGAAKSGSLPAIILTPCGTCTITPESPDSSATTKLLLFIKTTLSGRFRDIPDICSMQVLIISATALEINALREKVQQEAQQIPHQVSFLVTGPGLLAAAFSITKALTEQKPDLALQAGLAGTYSPLFQPGAVAAIATEEVFDCGVTEGGQFKNLFDLNLAAADEAPFKGGLLRNPDISRWEAAGLQAVRGITVNEITTRAATIQRVQQTGMPALESMEGAALHYAALQFSIPFLQLRAVSNEIGERDKSKWSFGPALQNLHHTILQILTNQQL